MAQSTHVRHREQTIEQIAVPVPLRWEFFHSYINQNVFINTSLDF